MVALRYLKYRHDLSDEVVLAPWVEKSDRQLFSGTAIFCARAADSSLAHDTVAQATRGSR
jgi:hypothetical protein